MKGPLSSRKENKVIKETVVIIDSMAMQIFSNYLQYFSFIMSKCDDIGRFYFRSFYKWVLKKLIISNTIQ